MFPLLEPGDEVLVDPRAYWQSPPQPGEIVVAQHPYKGDLKIIKRVVAVADNGRIHLRGDNPDPAESSDSRIFGPLPRSLILGRVTSRFGERIRSDELAR